MVKKIDIIDQENRDVLNLDWYKSHAKSHHRRCLCPEFTRFDWLGWQKSRTFLWILIFCYIFGLYYQNLSINVEIFSLFHCKS